MVRAMQRNIVELTQELIGLPKRDRLELVRFLLFLDSESLASNDVEMDWQLEITDRVQAIENNSAIGIDYDKAINDIKKRILK